MQKNLIFTVLFIAEKALFVICFFCIPLSIAHASTINIPANFISLNSGLVGWWTFDGSNTSNIARDVSGNGNHGTITNMSTTTAVVQGKVGQGLKFNGSNTYISLTNPGAFSFSQYTVTWWGYYTPGVDNNFAIAVGTTTSTGGTLTAYYNSGWRCGQFTSKTTTGSGSINKWAFNSCVFDGSTLSYYANGVLVNSVSATPSLDTPTLGYIGQTVSGGARMSGKLDDVRIYNRALSATEIQQLYNTTAGSKQNVSVTGPNLNSGLVGYWTFDGSNTSNIARDVSGNGNHGTITNMSTTTAVVQGKVGQGLKFDGVDDYIVIPDADDSKYVGNLSICVWANIRTGNAYRHFAGKHASNGATKNPFDFRTSSDAIPKLTLVRANNSSANVFEGPTITLNQWKFYCVVADSLIQDAPTFYIDATPTIGTKTSGTQTGPITGSGADIRIGIRADNLIKMDGNIDDVRIYNRVLSATEIQQLYNTTAGSKQNVSVTGPNLNSGLVGYWTFDGSNTSNIARDVSGNGNHGTITNMSTTTAVVQGKVGQGLKFDGVDDYVTKSSKVVSSYPYTLSGWVKSSGTQKGLLVGMTRTDGSGGLAYRMSIGITSAAKAYFEESIFGFTITGTSNIGNKWTHIVGVAAAANDRKLYVNGVLEGTSSGGSSFSFFIDRTSIGAAVFGTPEDYMDGSIDDVRIYNRALSATEIQQLYNMGR